MSWPNWVDLVLITICIRACYIGYARGVVTELLHVAVAVSLTSLTLNYWTVVSDIARRWLVFSPPVVNLLVFWLLFVTGLVAARFLIKRAGGLLGWERMHWLLQMLGVGLGAVRGLWWGGFFLLLLANSGVAYLQASVDERSLLSPRVAGVAREIIEMVADTFPGAAHRPNPPVPPLRPLRKRAHAAHS
ncbi:MAG: CvpA family protein [Candidatus Omnitrophica bacterium]|nr:CvpA family protein [Candidatus Omnitrophota bacterium]